MQIDPVRLPKVAAGNLGQVAPVGAEPVQAAETQPAAAAGTERLELSQRAGEVQAAHEALAQTPEVRAEKVAALKAQLAAGTYQIDADKIAEKLVPD